MVQKSKIILVFSDYLTYICTKKQNNSEMKQITIKVKDGEVTIPTVGKIVSDGQIKTLIRVDPNPRFKWAEVTYVYLTSCCGGICPADCFRAEEFANITPCTEDFWDKAIAQASLREIEKIQQFAQKFSNK